MTIEFRGFEKNSSDESDSDSSEEFDDENEFDVDNDSTGNNDHDMSGDEAGEPAAEGGDNDDNDDEDEVVKAIKAEKNKPRDHPPTITCEDFIVDISFNPARNLIALANIMGDVLLYEYNDNETKLVNTLELHVKACRDVEFDANGNIMYTTAKDKSIMATDVETGKLKNCIENAHEEPVYKLLCLDTNKIVTGDDAGTVKLWDLRKPDPIFNIKIGEEHVADMITTEARKYLVCAGGDGALTSIDLKGSKIYSTSEDYDSELTCMGLFRSDTKLLVGSSRGKLYLFNWKEFGLHSDEYIGEKHSISCMIPITQNIVVTSGEDGILRAAHMFPQRQLGVVGQHSLPVECLDISHDGCYIASCSHNNDVKFWNISYFETVDSIIDVNQKQNKKKDMSNNLPSSSRFGNQADHFLGVLAFSKTLNRTLVLPPWVEYRYGEPKSVQVPFDTYFKTESLAEYHTVMTMEYFMSIIAPSIWPEEKRFAFCYTQRGGDKENSCNAKSGNPFGPFWDTFNIDFTGSEFYGPLNYDASNTVMVDKWKQKYPPTKWPVLAFTGAPASFPVQGENRHLHKYMQWSDHIASSARQFIKKNMSGGGFLGVHLRNGQDWIRACQHVNDSPMLFAAPQCLGYKNERGTLTASMCLPSKTEIISVTRKAIMTTAEDICYEKALEYWSEIPATLDGVLGGFGFISDIDIEGSKLFLQSILTSPKAPATNLALDCGAGIGRISKYLLVPQFKSVDIVEPDEKFINSIHKYVGSDAPKLGNLYKKSLQEFRPEKKYDVIWNQNALSEHGVIIVKENVTSSGKTEKDDADSSVTRPLKEFIKIFSKAKLKRMKQCKQTNFPNGIYPVYMFALVPDTSEAKI
ncbi:hypothetical protein MSG28_002197 [Choristoneura fumiferana]|uniref:Uncharacterized protein n=1 Tax=Choristoneura fumiferana TaxID=7141 RepID=A0ACC0JUA9_CHOFU|nr:hypothetical protein MSG28_002197 [Choristoneura fumiferana]